MLRTDSAASIGGQGKLQCFFYTSFGLHLRQDCWFQMFCCIFYSILYLLPICTLPIIRWSSKKLPSIEH